MSKNSATNEDDRKLTPDDATKELLTYSIALQRPGVMMPEGKVQWYINQGANINAQYDGPNKKHIGKTALHLAAEMADTGFVDDLLKNGARTNIKDNKGKTAIDYVPEGKEYIKSHIKSYSSILPNIGKGMKKCLTLC